MEEIRVHVSDLIRRSVPFRVVELKYDEVRRQLPIGSKVFVRTDGEYVEGRISEHDYLKHHQGENIRIELKNGDVFLRPDNKYHRVYMEQ